MNKIMSSKTTLSQFCHFHSVQQPPLPLLLVAFC